VETVARDGSCLFRSICMFVGHEGQRNVLREKTLLLHLTFAG
jgi:hypothetical protein